VCAEVLAEERAERERLRKAYAIGSRRRAADVAAFAKLKDEASREIDAKEAEAAALDAEYEETHGAVDELKMKCLDTRLSEVSSRSLALATVPSPSDKEASSGVDEGLRGLFEPLTVNELAWFVVHSCQIAGEMESATPGKSCVPLRLAGLDAGLTWQPDTYELQRLDETLSDHLERKGTLADILDHNIVSANKIWDEKGLDKRRRSSSNSNDMRRRLSSEDEEHDSDDFDGDHDDYVGGDEDDYVPPDDDHHSDDDADSDDDHDDDAFAKDRADNYHSKSRSESTSASADDAGTKRDEIESAIRQRPFSSTRTSFLELMSVLIERIEEAEAEIAAAEDKGEKEEAADEEGESAEETKDTSTEDGTDNTEDKKFDPLALPMVRNRLEKIEKLVQRGVDYAVSAKVLLDSVNDFKHESEEQRREDMYRLAAGTLYHGKLSTQHVWQILQSVVPELSGSDGTSSASGDNDNDQTCRSPWAASCPPRTIERSAGSARFTFPPETVVKAGEAFCETQYGEAAAEAACVGSLVEAGAIPSEIPQGFMGFYEPHPREDNDPLESALSPFSFDTKSKSKTELVNLLDAQSKIDRDRKNIRKDVDTLKEKIGYDDPEKFGDDGELHALKDKCFEIDTGKYTYELCMFGEAQQKDTGSKGRGTNLGRWSGLDIDEETGKWLWRWDKGQKCWNGPQRTATAYVTCGEEMAVVKSAEEPEMCRYVLDVESYIACDEAFAVLHELDVEDEQALR